MLAAHIDYRRVCKRTIVTIVCSSWLRGRDPSMTLEAFRNLWCHRDTLASVCTVHNGTEDRLDLVLHLSGTVPVHLL